MLQQSRCLFRAPLFSSLLSVNSNSALVPVVREGCEAVFKHHNVHLTDPNSSSPSTPAMRLLTCRASDKSKLNRELCRTLLHTGISWTLMIS